MTTGIAPPSASRARSRRRRPGPTRTIATTAAASSGRNEICSVRVARLTELPVSNQRRWDNAQTAHRMNSTIGVFSRGPVVARSMNPWKLSIVAAAARPAARELKTCRPTT